MFTFSTPIIPPSLHTPFCFNYAHCVCLFTLPCISSSLQNSVYYRHHYKSWPFIRVPGYLSPYSDSLRAGRSGDRITLQARFSAPVQTGPGVLPVYYTMGTGSLPGVKRPGRGLVHPPLSSVEVKERVELYIYSTSEPSWPVIGSPLTLLLPLLTLMKCWCAVVC